MRPHPVSDEGRADLEVAQRRLEQAGLESLDTDALQARVTAARIEVMLLSDHARLLCRQLEACAIRLVNLEDEHLDTIRQLFGGDPPDDTSYQFERTTGFDPALYEFDQVLDLLHQTLRTWPQRPPA